MGNWKHRPSRRQYHQKNPQYDYELPAECFQDNVPPWEKKFCYVVGSVPWRKVVSAKYFTSDNSNVLNWDDSAVEETFQNAKERFWAEMNGFRCDISPPDPDIYIDEIDWSPNVDLELMKELDRDFFAPADEEAEATNKLLRKYKRKLRYSGCGPSEWNGTKVNGVVSESKEFDQSEWNDRATVSKKIDSKAGSWEVEAVPENKVVETWGLDGNKSSGGCEGTNRDCTENTWERSDQGSVLMKANGQGDILDKDFDGTNRECSENPWERGNRGSDSRKANGWDGGCDKDRGWNQGDWINSASVDSYNRGFNNKGWNDHGGEARRGGGRYFMSYRSQNRDFESRRSNSRGEVWHRNDSFQRSEGYYDYHHHRHRQRQNDFGYGNTRFRQEENRASDCWVTRGNNKRRVSFE